MLFAAHWKLNNLIVIFDCNGYQAMGATEDIMNLNSMKKKLEAFNFETLEIDGHDRLAIENSIRQLSKSSDSKPKAIIANTVKGKGVSFMHANNECHYTRLNPETYKAALAELGYGA